MQLAQLIYSEVLDALLVRIIFVFYFLFILDQSNVFNFLLTGPAAGGWVADNLGGPVKAFYYSAGCFTVGLALALVVSFGAMCCKKANDNKTDETKAIDDSDLNKNLISNKAQKKQQQIFKIQLNKQKRKQKIDDFCFYFVKSKSPVFTKNYT